MTTRWHLKTFEGFMFKRNSNIMRWHVKILEYSNIRGIAAVPAHAVHGIWPPQAVRFNISSGLPVPVPFVSFLLLPWEVFPALWGFLWFMDECLRCEAM